MGDSDPSPAPFRPTGTVSFLFTDLEGSTRLAQEFPDALPALLARHHALLRQAIETHHGIVFQIVGDAFCAAFPTAPEALAGAIEAQRLLQTEPWERAPIRVRIGIHTGAAQAVTTNPVSGGYVGYSTLARTERIVTAAHGGQILLSNACAGLVREELPPGVTLRDLQEHRLKGSLNPERLWQVVAPDLRQDFPPLSTLDRIPNNLPLQATSFVGREKDIEEVKRLLSTTRLLSLTGSGGTGKTRLSLQVGVEVLDGYKNGVWFVELAPLADPGLVVSAVAKVLGLREEPGCPLLQTVLTFLQNRQLLLILDNCEHLLEACARFAAEALLAAPNLRIMASSREPLGIAGELAWRVPCLPTPDPKITVPIEQLEQYAAVRLFIDRAIFARPAFQVNNANAPAVAQICYQLDGIPLAIELAAVRLRALSAEQVAAHLDNRFRLLTGGSRTALPRHQTLRAAIDWSYDLLSGPERILTRRLSPFAGGFTLEAAEEICSGNGLEPHELLDLLTRLVDKSLVVAEENGDAVRYRMLETIREYARERLVKSGEEQSVKTRHLEFFLKFAEEADPKLGGADQITWLNRVEREHENLRAALTWSEAAEEGAEAEMRLAGALRGFWYEHGYFNEGRAWLDSALERTSAALPRWRANALSGAGTLAWCQGDYQRAMGFHDASLALYRELGDQGGVAFSLQNLGVQAEMLGDYDRAKELLEEGVTLYRELRDKAGIALALNNLGEVARCQGDYNRARMLYAESLSLAREGGQGGNIIIALFNLGAVATRQGNHDLARSLLEEGLSLSKERGDKRAIAAYLGESAVLCSARGRWERAARLFGAAELLRGAINFHLEASDCADYDRQVTGVRNQLGDLAFDRACSEGQAMTLEQAIDYALKNE